LLKREAGWYVLPAGLLSVCSNEPMAIWPVLDCRHAVLVFVIFGGAAGLGVDDSGSKAPRKKLRSLQTSLVDASASFRSHGRNRSDATSAAFAELQAEEAASQATKANSGGDGGLPFGLDADDPRDWAILWAGCSFVVGALCLLCRVWSAYSAAQSASRSVKAAAQGDFSAAGKHGLTAVGHAVEARFGLVKGRLINTVATEVGKGAVTVGSKAISNAQANTADAYLTVSTAVYGAPPKKGAKTKKTKTQKAVEAPQVAEGTQAAAGDGWTENVDPGTGRTYYYNAATGATSWTKPSAEPAANVAEGTQVAAAANVVAPEETKQKEKSRKKKTKKAEGAKDVEDGWLPDADKLDELT